LLPFEFGNLSDTVQTYLKELKTLSQKMQDDIKERNKEIEEGVFKATDDPKKPLVAPSVEAVPPHLNFAPMENAVDALNRSAGEYRKALEQAGVNGGAALASASLADVNKMLIESERRLTNADGLPNRPWFKHQLYAPGFYTGYGVKTVPAVREAIELKKWQDADKAIVVVADVLQNEAALVSSAAAKLTAATSH
jgi:N-acetylated-alpha-linked acidic dipeptidase